MAWIWIAIIFGLLLTWGFEIRIKDLYNRMKEQEGNISSLKDEVAEIKRVFRK